MDKREAMLILQSCRSDGQDADHPAFAEALTLAGSDTELKEWWEAQQAFDRQITRRLRETPIPMDLRATILAGRKVEQLSRNKRLPYWFAVAALLMLLVVADFHLTSSKSNTAPSMSYAEYSSSIIHYVDGNPSLSFMTDDSHKIDTWLADKGAPLPHLTAALHPLSPLGCEKFSVHGHTVSFICLQMANGGVVHLFVVNRQALENSPGTSPQIEEHNGWTTASWSDGDKTYFIASQASPEAVRALL